MKIKISSKKKNIININKEQEINKISININKKILSQKKIQ